MEAPAPLPAEAGEGLGVAPAAAIEPAGPGGLFGDDAPWPMDEAGESAFLAGAKERGETVGPVVPAVAAAAAEPEETGALPALDELVQRIPPGVRGLLDELYRVKFTTVRRVPAKSLK